MDHATSAILKARAVYIANEIHRFAQRKGWRPGSYLISASVDLNSYMIRMKILSSHFSEGDEGDVSEQDYLELIQYLRDALADVRGLYETLSVQLYTCDDPDDLPRYFLSMLGEDEVEVDSEALNPEVEDPGMPVPQVRAEGGN